MPIHLGATPQGHVQQKARLAREGVGLDRFTLDQAGIAQRGFLTRYTPIHQHHIEPALLQMQGGAGANHARAQNKNR
jgi:hypothetical protein